MPSLIKIFLLSLCFILVHSTLLTYKVYQTDDICSFNWRRSICLPIFRLKRTNRSSQIQIDIRDKTFCFNRSLIYIRPKSCLYCPKSFILIHCEKRIVYEKQNERKRFSGKRFIAPVLGCIGLLLLFSVVFVFVIKRTPAQTNLFEPKLVKNVQKPPKVVKTTNELQKPAQTTVKPFR